MRQARCPTCGNLLGKTKDQVIALLKRKPDRDLYKGCDGNWYVSHGGGCVSYNTVQELVDSGEVNSCYSSIPNECYHVGKTIDCEQTIAYRRRTRQALAIVYTDGSTARTNDAK